VIWQIRPRSSFFQIEPAAWTNLRQYLAVAGWTTKEAFGELVVASGSYAASSQANS
jgi:hypothetical protein